VIMGWNGTWHRHPVVVWNNLVYPGANNQ
jgi:hypothetical protein